MRMLIAILAAGMIAGASEAAAQPAATPKNCAYYVVIEAGQIAFYPPSGPKCNHRGKFQMAINNLDALDYDLRLDTFKYKEKADPNDACYTPSDIKSTGTAAKPPFRNQTLTYVKIDLGNSNVTKFTRFFAKEGDVHTACYAFDIKLYADGNTSTPLDHEDPDLEVAEPGNPPPQRNQN